MGIVSLSPAGRIGLNLDIKPAELPPQAWSGGINVSFCDGAAGPVLDPTKLNSGLATQPNWACPTQITTTELASWLVASPTKIYAYITGVLTDITRAAGGDYTGGSSNRWSGGVLNGITVASNGVDVPQVWMTADSTVKCVDLPNWPSTVRARCLRPFKHYLVALDVTKGSSRYPTMVKWCHPADSGTVPASWDETDPTKDAGEYSLAESPGPCIDALPLRDINIIYKSDSVWAMQYIGGTYIFKFYRLFGDFGTPTRDCVVEYQPGMHFVFTGDDLRVHDGRTVRSVITGKMQKLITGFTASQIRSCYVVHNTSQKEVWFCFRRKDDGVHGTDTALTWSYIDESLGLRELPDYKFMANGRLDPPVTGVISWADAGGVWVDHPEEWGEAVVIPSTTRLLGLGALSIEWVDSKSQCSLPTKLERTYLGIPVRTDSPPDLSASKCLLRVWPRIVGKAGDVIWITFGGADSVNQPIEWETPQQFVLGTDDVLDPTITWKMFAIRLESQDTAPWVFNGLDAEIIATGV